MKKNVSSLWHSKASLVSQQYSSNSDVLDVSDMDERLGVSDSARQLASSNLPNPQSQSLSSTETQIVQAIERHRQKKFDQTMVEMQSVQNEISQLNELPDLQNVWLIETNFEREATQLVSEQSQLIRSLASNAQKKVRELNRFKEQNNLQREPEYPSSSSQFLRYCLLIFLIVIEALFNAEFFSEGLSTGLLGGFTYAASLAAINVLLSFFLGKSVIRLINHRTISQKVAGLIALFFTILFMFTMAIAIAHIRDQLVMESLEPAKMALIELKKNPLEFADLFSWLLFAVSVSFAFGALMDGLFIDDLYPGYGALARKSEAALNDYFEELDEVRQELEEYKLSALLDLEKSIEKAKSSISNYRNFIDRKKTIKLKYEQILSDSERALVLLIQHFRTENEMHRTDGLRPMYYDHLPILKKLEIPWVEQDEQQLILHTRLMQTLTSQSEDIRNKLHQTFQKYLDQLVFVPIDELDPLQQRYN
jgi:hypothetical protein